MTIFSSSNFPRSQRVCDPRPPVTDRLETHNRDLLILLVIIAHPDDEAFGMAGTLAQAAAAGVRTALICATRGEAGQSAGLAETRQALSALRSEELRCSAATLGVSDLVLLDYPDGGAESWDMAALVRELTTHIRCIAPDVVVTFDDQGITRHPDHMAVHRAVRLALEAAADRLGVRRLFYQVITCPEEASPEGPTYACVSPEAVDVTVDIRAVEPVKRAALACHRTQAADTSWMLSQPEGSLAAEHYILAWDAAGWRPATGAGDLLTGL